MGGNEQEKSEEEQTIIRSDENVVPRTPNDTNTVDLRKTRVTQLPTNRRVIIPDQQGVQLKQHLQHLKA